MDGSRQTKIAILKDLISEGYIEVSRVGAHNTKYLALTDKGHAKMEMMAPSDPLRGEECSSDGSWLGEIRLDVQDGADTIRPQSIKSGQRVRHQGSQIVFHDGINADSQSFTQNSSSNESSIHKHRGRVELCGRKVEHNSRQPVVSLIFLSKCIENSIQYLSTEAPDIDMALSSLKIAKAELDKLGGDQSLEAQIALKMLSSVDPNLLQKLISSNSESQD